MAIPFSTMFNKKNTDYFYSGIEKIGQNDLKAIELFSRAIDNDPKCAKAYFYRGITFYFLTEYSKAIADFTKAMDLNPMYKFQANFNLELAKSFLDK